MQMPTPELIWGPKRSEEWLDDSEVKFEEAVISWGREVLTRQWAKGLTRKGDKEE